MGARKWELDYLRVMACLFVVVIHVAGYGMEAMDPHTGNWLLRNVVTSLVRCAAPLFFMLSGILFMEREIPLKKLYGKYILRIFVGWAVWSAFYAAIDYIAARKNGGASFGYFAERFLSGHYHLWFLPSLIVAYIFLPFLQQVLVRGSRKLAQYAALLVLIGGVLTESLSPFIEGAGWDAWKDNFSLSFIPVGIVYFSLGYCLYREREKLSARGGFALYMIAVLFMVAGNWIWAWKTGVHQAVMFDYLSLCVMLSAAGMLVFCLKVFPRGEPQKRRMRMLKELSDCTFGIYLVHTLFIEQVFRRVGLTQDKFPAGVSIVLFSVLTFVCSFAVVWCMRRLPAIGKWIV